MLVAVDTGGTKTLVAVFDTDGVIVAKQKFPTPVDVTDYLAELTKTIDDLISTPDITCISIALPGTIVDGRMVWAGNLGWHDTDMRALLGGHYSCPIIVENDANLAGLAEARAFTPIPDKCLYITISTGIGTGIITNGKIDSNFSTSEGGEIIIEHDGTLQFWEKFASGKALLEKYGMLASDITDPAVWEEVAHNVAAGLLVHCPILRPDIVIIGGGVGAHFDKFGPRVTEILVDTMKDMYHTKVVKASHPEEAVIYGCYYHALDVGAA
jgi:predicted NBD/HSP70 family sugar kinase